MYERGTTARKREKMNWKVYSPRCAAATSCSTRTACSPVGWSTEYASWGQVTICQIRPIGHVRCAVYYVCVRECVYNVTLVCYRVSHACNALPVSSRLPTCSPSGRVASRIFVRRPEGHRHALPALSGALGRGTDSRNVVYDFHRARPRALFSILLSAPANIQTRARVY